MIKRKKIIKAKVFALKAKINAITKEMEIK